MLIVNEKTKRVNAFMDKVENERQERHKRAQEDAKLAGELRQMSREGDSVNRTNRIRNVRDFNTKFIGKLARLSKIRQTTGTMSRDDAARIVREIKAQ